MGKEGDTFGKRVEKKFLVEDSIIKDLALKGHGDFAQKFEFDHFSPESIFTIVENIHFDNYNLDSYHQAMAKEAERYKLRVRYYAQDGLPESKLFFEIKSKVGKDTEKVRVTLKKSMLRPLLRTGKFPDDRVFELNENKDPRKVKEILDKIIYLTQDEGFKPVLKSSYMRFAFKLRESGQVRLTMDRDIRFTKLGFTCEPQELYTKTISDKDVIVELKIGDPEFSHLAEYFTEKFGKPSGFSKYCFGICDTMNRFLTSDMENAVKAMDAYRDLSKVKGEAG